MKRRLIHELKAVGWVAFYFGCWLSALVLIKTLLLKSYQIEFSGVSRVLVGTIVLSKVVLVLEKVPLGTWVRSRPAWVDVVLRTALFAGGVFVLVWLERSFDKRHAYGGFGPALTAVFQHADAAHILVNTFCLTIALLGYNALAVIRKYLGTGGLLRFFLSPLPAPFDIAEKSQDSTDQRTQLRQRDRPK